ncbi:hypothetical protein MUN84_21515 [Hymenobacter sp. 5516J-16]|uniref:STAS/SEC14 domain-containing protein n=1 Tax=Hymenobacter sublimis TaxID=2933777 RepID=A0ABY4JDN8_9BACT|nr:MULTISPECIES: hypothetical protein [Hymenobacter]UOQ77015.1 hypothetical protein MUN84_21515 [Hymenobacter sp. 5516J-16]UPL50700.1 hypothetical protein MWH26_07305 [Hymenobacter sublimis]
MLYRLLSNPDRPNYCQLSYDETHHWLRATWAGHIGPDYAREGATVGLQMLEQVHCPYLLNDNSKVVGPWFDSLEWLAATWGPLAAEAGLRYVAHIAQADAVVNTWSVADSKRLLRQFEIQIFDSEFEAVEWLSSCQRQVG